MPGNAKNKAPDPGGTIDRLALVLTQHATPTVPGRRLLVPQRLHDEDRHGSRDLQTVARPDPIPNCPYRISAYSPSARRGSVPASPFLFVKLFEKGELRAIRWGPNFGSIA